MANGRIALVAGGLSALVGASLWAVKSATILLTGYQPPLSFEAAPALFAFTVASMASVHATRLSRAALVTGGFACIAGIVAVGRELTGDSSDAALTLAMLGVILGLTMVGEATRRESGSPGRAGRLAFALGLATIPALAVGGLLSAINERLLEVPLFVLACTWSWLGSLMLRLGVR